MQEEVRKDKESDKRSLMISVPAFLVHKRDVVYGKCQACESAEFEIAISRVCQSRRLTPTWEEVVSRSRLLICTLSLSYDECVDA
jgi:hypothetical protein